MSSIGVVLDACVLFPGSLRDTLLRAADADLYRLSITDQILEEVKRNLAQKGHTTESKAQYIIEQIKTYFAGSLITSHTLLIPSMPINEKDRHVLAAAVASSSQIIVTQNLKDFPQELLTPFEVEAMSADTFLLHQLSQDKETMVNIITEQASDLKKPPLEPLDVLDKLESMVPQFCQLIRKEFKTKETEYNLDYQKVFQRHIRRFKPS